jgi:formyltetrahydrofolate deformylase
MSSTAILLVQAPDARGLVAGISDFVFRNNGNVVDADQHTDTEAGLFFMRIEWQLDDFKLAREDISAAFAQWADPRKAKFRLYFSDVKPRIAIFVSKLDHCLHDLLLRRRAGEFQADIPLIISNHPDLEEVAKLYSVEFKCFPITAATKRDQERAELELLRRERVDTIILARYMQVLSEQIVAAYPNEIINIHHSFLPAFAGGKPYQQAHRRGVKVIGASSHYVTTELDEGPIIEQDVTRVTHRDSVDDMVRKGRDLEKLVLARAVRLHLGRRVLVQENRTVVFE